MGICIKDGEKVICCSQTREGEYVTPLSIGLVTPGGVSILRAWLLMCMHEGAQTQTLPPHAGAPAEDSRYRVTGVKKGVRQRSDSGS